jgi:hypothetical protein
MPCKILIPVFLCFFAEAYGLDSLACQGKFNANGQKHGLWACREAGRVVRKENYKNGVLTSYTIFNDKGEVIETRNRKGRIRKYTPCGC